MPDEFQFDVFLCHSVKAGDSIPAKIEEGLEHLRVLACPAEASARRWMLCMSAHAFGSDWAQLQ